MPIDIPETQQSSYLENLPAVFQQDAGEGGVTFLGRFLLAFEMILNGLEYEDFPGLQEKIQRIHTYFNPGAEEPESQRTPDEFLPWLAGWVALTLREDWGPEEKRRFIGRVVPLYRQRGTKEGLAELLRVYTGLGVEIYEFNQPMQVGSFSTVGVDTLLGGGPPYYFLVKMLFETPDPVALANKQQMARAIIDQEKPAHTYYDLEVEVPTMQIGVYSTVGVDTLLGTTTAEGPAPSP